MKLPKLIVIVGPTASGKTRLALSLAKKFNGEIISADSRQVYKGMDIGTAKPEVRRTSGISNFKFLISNKILNSPPTPRLRRAGKFQIQGIAHYMIDIVKPNETFTAAHFKKMAIRAIRDVWRRGKLPILIGGSGLYIQAVVDNLQIPLVAPNKKLRRHLEKKTVAELVKILVKMDSVAARRYAPNRRYLIRAIEVAGKTGKKISETQKKDPPLFDTLQIGLTMPRAELYRRINARVEAMIRRGLLKEVKTLIKKYPRARPLYDSLGYQEIIAHLRGKTSLDETVRLIKKNTRHYAKRQMTWFKRDKRIHWVKDASRATRLVKQFLNLYS